MSTLPYPFDEASEIAYNPRRSVGDVPAIMARWQGNAEATRRAHPLFETMRYGDHPREVFDLFRTAAPKGMLIFIHGGYWRMLSKDEHSFVASVLPGLGYSVAVLNYPLCPEVQVGDIVHAIRRAILALLPRLLPEERTSLVIAGHSAGGYLTAAMLAQDWESSGLKGQPFKGALSISGVFELAPLMKTSMNELIRLDSTQVSDLALGARRPEILPPFLLAVGADETPEFHAQSQTLAAQWGLEPGAVLSIAGCNHFTVIEQLGTPGSALLGALLRLFETPQN